MSQRSPDSDSRFCHLLQPIRDLTKNWEIDIAAQLEEYLAEIETIRISFDGGATTMNFAEAALLIQGSACIYSRKVEYLYTMVFQTLDLLVSKKKLQQASSLDPQGKDKDVTLFEQNQEFFLALDDFPENKKADEVHPEKDIYDENENVIPSAQLSLFKLDDTERETPMLNRKGEILGYKGDFNVGATLMHGSGIQFLEPGKFSALEMSILALQSSTPIHPLRTQDMQTANQEDGLIPDMPEDFNDVPAHDMSADDVEMGDILEDSFGRDTKPIKEEFQKRELRPRIAGMIPKPIKEVVDPWKLLDPHDSSGFSEKPFKKGRCFRLPPSLAKAKGKGNKRKRQPGKPQLMPIADLITKAYYSHASKLPSNPIKLPSLPEFHNIFWEVYKKQQSTIRRLKSMLMEQGKYEELQEIEQEEKKEQEQQSARLTSGDDDEGFEDFGFVPDDDHMPDLPYPEDNAKHELENSQGTVISSYEDLVRQHVENYLASAQQYAQVTALSKRVSNWEEKIAPILKREEEFGFFDIHDYGTIVLNNLEKKSLEQTKDRVGFAEVVDDKEAFDISRLFLAALQLANTYNVEIQSRGEGNESMDTMSLKLLSKRRHHEDMADYRAPSVHS